MSLEFSNKFPQWKNPALVYLLILIIVVLTALDILTTRAILDLGGIEFNPFMASVIPYFIPIRFLTLIAILGLAGLAEKVKPGAGLLPLASASSAFIIPVLNNFLVLKGEFL